MEGRAPVGANNVLSQKPGETFVYTLGGKWFSPAFEPAHTTESKFGGSRFPQVFPANVRNGIGPGLFFADEWARLNDGNQRVVLVPIAKGGTKISLHAPSMSLATLYGAGRAQINEAKKHGKVLVILWSQGEGDARTSADANNYAKRFIALVKAWRADHGNVPVVFTQLGDNPHKPEYPYWDLVSHQQDIAAANIPNSYMIKTRGLSTIPKDAPVLSSREHYTAMSESIIGRNMALALHYLLTR